MYHAQTHEKVSWRHTLIATGSRPFLIEYAISGQFWPFAHLSIISSKTIYPSHFKCCQCHLNTSIILNGAFCEFSPYRVAVTTQRISAIRHETGNSYKSQVLFPICPTFQMLDNSPALNTSTCQYSLIFIAPPTGNRK